MFVEVKSGMLLNLDRIDYIEPPKNGNGSIIHFGARSVDIPAPIEELIDIMITYGYGGQKKETK